MKVTGSRSSQRSASISDRVSASRFEQAPSLRSVNDITSVAGIPESELTPRVREALFSLMEEVGQLREQLADMRVQMESLKTLADADPLLGVLNRRAFVRELDRAVAMVKRYHVPASLVFIDLDNMKSINDRFGHSAGDAALAHVARVLSENIRQTDRLGRLGGDEFGLILTQTEADAARHKAEMLAKAIAAHPLSLSAENDEMRITVTCGVAPLVERLSPQDALSAADADMYERKIRRKA